MNINKKFALTLGLIVCLGLTGCAGKQAFRKGQALALKGDYDGAVSQYMTAVDRNPNRHEYRARLDEALAEAAWRHLEAGRELVKNRAHEAAVEEFRKAREFDKTLVAAENELKAAERLVRADKLITQADELVRNRRLQQARNLLDEALLVDPQHPAGLELLEKVKNSRTAIIDGVELDMTSDKPISLKFRETSIKDAFNILSKLTGVNFILDDEIKKKNFTFELVDVSFPQALELILQMNKLGKKVVNPKTIIIFSRSKDGDKQFNDQIIQTFYLSNIDAKKAVNLLRTMLQLRRVYVHEELNAIVVRDTADVIKLCTQLLDAADRADAEVMFDLELIEVNHTDKLDFGPKLSSNSTSVGLGKIASNGTASLVSTALTDGSAALIKGTSGLADLKVFYTLPTLTFDFLKTRTDTEVLANPKIRVKNKEKAKVHIGSKEPVITVTVNGDNRSDNVTYVDVGVKLDVEPIIQLDNSVVTKITLEVSSVSDRQKTDNGTQVLTLTTTNAQSSLTLRDGERTIIGGLVRDDNSKSRSGMAFLSDLPLLGELLTSHTNSKAKREILLSITPRIVQNVVVPQAETGTIWSGNEDDLKAGPVFGTFTRSDDAVTAEAPAAPAPPAPAAKRPPTPVAPAGKAQVPPPPPETPVVAPPPPAEENGAEPLAPELAPEAPVVPGETAPGVPAETADEAAAGESSTAPTEAVPAVDTTSAAPATAPALVAPPTAAPVATESSAPLATGAAAAPVTAEKLVEIPPFEVPPAGDGRLVVSGPQSVKVGQEITLEIRGTAIRNLFSAPLFVVFDQERFEFLAAEEGELLRQGGTATVFTSSRISGRGEVIVGYKQGVGGAGATGDGSLFRLKLKAKAAGPAAVRLDRLNLRDAQGNRLNLEAPSWQAEIR